MSIVVLYNCSTSIYVRSDLEMLKFFLFNNYRDEIYLNVGLSPSGMYCILAEPSFLLYISSLEVLDSSTIVESHCYRG